MASHGGDGVARAAGESKPVRGAALTLVEAPSNLGLRPPGPGREPGTWRAPEALLKAGLRETINPQRVIDLPRPAYEAAPQPGTRLRNGNTMRAFNLGLADTIEEVARDGDFALVVGGDCSILLGALAGCRRLGPVSLVHIDGHSDFRHPGNHDFAATLGSVAGMDLALATGRGEALMTEWPGTPSPLVPDEAVIQIGERESRDADYEWPDIFATAITRIDAFSAAEMSAGDIVSAIRRVLDRTRWPFWLHLDVDVLDQSIMPAVDSPGSPGLDPCVLEALLDALVADHACRGLTVAVFDPDLDPDGGYAAYLVRLLARVPQALHRRVYSKRTNSR